jgi:BCD family chlorophyll transporter-like MFS transporter
VKYAVNNKNNSLGWLGIFRLGLVQTALGAIVVLTTSTMNRVMVVELALPAMLPGALVALHYAMQVFRPRLGHGSDVGGRRTPWIIGGMAILAAGGVLAALATAWMGSDKLPAILLAIAAYALIGIGVGAAGTSLLVLLAKRVDPGRRAAAATVVWIMMIGGFAVTAGVAGHLLDPFSPARLVEVTAIVAASAFLVSLVAVWGVESAASPAQNAPAQSTGPATAKPSFREALSQVWEEPRARRFAIFIFVSMLAYGAQDLILDPFAGAVFGFTPGQSTKLSGIQHGGVLLGMIMVGIAVSAIGRGRVGSLRTWSVGGCLASALALFGLAMAGYVGPAWPLKPSVFLLGVANGAYAIAAIGSMMALVGSGRESREGVRMGLWGAAQAIAFGLGGFLGTVASDLARYLFGSPVVAYSVVFGCEAALFVVAAVLAARIESAESAPAARQNDGPISIVRNDYVAGVSQT